MTVKQFFKSTAFKSLAVLLAIVIIAGALLAIFNDLLFVSEDEKFNRVIAKIYGGNASVEKTMEVTEENNTYSDGSVSAAYLMSDGNYLVQSTGTGAFGGGTVTVWAVVEMKNGALSGVGKVVFESTTVSKYYETDSAFFKKFDTSDEKVAAGEYFGVSDGIVNPSTGATASARAINNAVNTAIDFIKSAVLGESVGGASYEHQDWITGKPEITPDTDNMKVEYAFTAKAFGNAPDIKVNITVVEGKITEYTVEGDWMYHYDDHVDATLSGGSFFKDKSLADLEALLVDGETSSSKLGEVDLATGATHSSTVLIRAAVFALANFKIALYPVQYTDWVTDETHTVDSTVSSVVYELTAKAFGNAPDIKVNITVVEGKITEYTVEGDWMYHYDDHVDATLSGGSFFKDKSLADLEALLADGETSSSMLGEADLATGATHSSTVLIRAAVYALANYAGYMAKEGGNEA